MDKDNYILFLQEYMHMVRFASRTIKEKYDRDKVSKESPLLLHLIERYGPLTQRQLADKLKIKPYTLSVRLQRLEDLHFITRQDDPNDKRIQNVVLTGEGKQMLDEIFDSLMIMMKTSFADFSEEEIKQMISYIERINKNLKKGLEKYD